MDNLFTRLFTPQVAVPARATGPLPPVQPKTPAIPAAAAEAPETAPNRASSASTGNYAEAGIDPNAMRFNVTDSTATVTNDSTFSSNSLTSMDMNENGGVFSTELVVAGSTENDQGQQLRDNFKGIGPPGANNALSSRGMPPELNARAKAAMETLRASMPDGRHERELNVYMRALIDQRKPPLSNERLTAVLESAAAMTARQYDPRIGPSHELVLSALHDVAAPSNIAQRSEGTCMAGAAQMQIAMNQPERYLDMVGSLAANQPYAPDGAALLQPNWSFLGENGMALYRTPSTALMQNAIIDAINGGAGYDTSTAAISNGGADRNALGRLLPALLGESGRMQDVGSADAALNANPSRENPVFVAMRWTDKGEDHNYHALNLIGVDTASQQVTVMNPWGREESFSIAEFQSRFYYGMM